MLLSPVVRSSNTELPTPTFLSAELKVPTCVLWPIIKLSVNSAPPSINGIEPEIVTHSNIEPEEGTFNTWPAVPIALGIVKCWFDIVPATLISPLKRELLLLATSSTTGA